MSDEDGVEYDEQPAGIVEEIKDAVQQEEQVSSLPPPSPTTSTQDTQATATPATTRSSRRLSGFFNNLIHRQPRTPAPTPAQILPEEKDPPVTLIPPPRLPPPTLQELGLSLSVLTPDLSPSHFSTPPSSGAFLSPHYLLLCHAQGLDVLPLVSPPEPQPYALIRRVSFKSIVVMEQRGVLVAIAGRRDGVRVYALEEIRKAVEWRIDVEVRREKERMRREMAKRVVSNVVKTPTTPPVPLIPRTATIRRIPTPPTDRPPPYSPPHSPSHELHPQPSVPSLQPRTSTLSLRSRGHSVSEVLSVPRLTTEPRDDDAKWVESSDDEAINVVAAGSSGSQALDERTSSRHITRRNRPANLDLSLTRTNSGPPPEPSPAPTLLTLRQALAHPPLRDNTPETPHDIDDDDDERGSNSISLSQALLESRLPDLPPPGTRRPQMPILISADEPSSPRNSVSQRSDTTPNRRRRWSLMLSQSFNDPPSPRRPASATGTSPPPPLGPVPPLPSDAALVVSATPRSRFIPRIISSAIQSMKISDTERPSTAGGSDDTKRANGNLLLAHAPPPKLEYVKLPGTRGSLMIKAVETAKKRKADPRSLDRSFLAILCGESGEKVELFAGTYRTALGLSRTFILPDSPRSLELQLQGDDLVEVFLVFSQNVFGLEPATVRVREVRIGRAERRAARRRARELGGGRTGGDGEAEDAVNNDSENGGAGGEETNVNVSIGVSVSVGATVVANGTGHPPPTPQFIPNEHPQDRTVPSTPIGDSHDGTSTPPVSTATSNNPNSASASAADELIALATARMGPYTTFQQLSFAPRFPLASIADEYVIPPTYGEFVDYREEHEGGATSAVDDGGVTPTGEGRSDSVDLALANFSPPGLPVPVPSAPSKWFYRDPKGTVHGPWKPSLMQAWYKDGLLPPDLPVRKEEDTEYTLLKDLRLQSLDPTHPFKPPTPSQSGSTSQSNLSHSQSNSQGSNPALDPFRPSTKPLLKPISLLAQPRHFGPPALFYSSRGGHSTAIVDARGRSVLKGRFLWSDDSSPYDSTPLLNGASEKTASSSSLTNTNSNTTQHLTRSNTNTNTRTHTHRMGDVKRVEALDITNYSNPSSTPRSILIAMRQGGVEAVDLGDALLRPADESRMTLPGFFPGAGTVNRRAPFVWRIGTPVGGSHSLNSTQLGGDGGGNSMNMMSSGGSAGGTILSGSSSRTKNGNLGKAKLSAGLGMGMGMGGTRSPGLQRSASVSGNSSSGHTHGGNHASNGSRSAGRNGNGSGNGRNGNGNGGRNGNGTNNDSGGGSHHGHDRDRDAESSGEFHDEVLFLGRKDDEIYICERNSGSFRILRLGPR